MEKEAINRLIAEWSGINRGDFDSDLNAIHEVEEKLLLNEPCKNYRYHLEQVSGCTWHATATQRAEALLKTIGKWKE